MIGGKPILPALLLLITISSPSIIFIVLQVQQFLVKQEMAERMEVQRLQTIQLRADKIQWYDGEDEIIVEGKLFDVQSFTKQEGDIFLFTGLFDEEETDIKKEVEKLLQKKNGDSNERNAAARFFFIPIVNELAGKLSNYPIDFLHGVWGKSVTGRLPDIYLSVISPPPEL